MLKKALIIDITRCIGCFNCQIACKDEHVGNDWSPYAKPQPLAGQFWMKIDMIERGRFPKVKVAYIPQPCMHCEKPKCKEAARNDAVYVRADGIVIIDPERAKGQKQIAEACPYGRIYWNEELQIPQKCTLCAHLLDRGWKQPRCVEACPSNAIIFEDYEKVRELAEKAEVLHPEYGTKPSVLYIGLPKRFIAGSVYCPETDVRVEGALVTLKCLDTQAIRATKTNNYGDFEFEGLDVNKEFSVRIEAEGYYPIQIDKIFTKKDVYLGDIYLQPKVV